ncbi:MAG: DUF1499 domain-containing protein [Pyrinomonadaceae bacterium]
MKKTIIGILIFLVIAIIGIVIIGRTFYPDNIAQTSADGGEKGLKTRFYKTDLNTAVKAVSDVVPTLSTYGSGWKLVGTNLGKGDAASTIKAEVPVVVFTDDLEVTVKSTEDRVQVDVRSQSRIGKSDFGENARHVRKILEALDEKLK